MHGKRLSNLHVQMRCAILQIFDWHNSYLISVTGHSSTTEWHLVAKTSSIGMRIAQGAKLARSHRWSCICLQEQNNEPRGKSQPLLHNKSNPLQERLLLLQQEVHCLLSKANSSGKNTDSPLRYQNADCNAA